MNTTIGNLFLALNVQDRSKVNTLLMDIGLCIEFDTEYRHLIGKAAAGTEGDYRKLLDQIFAMTTEQLDKIIGILVKMK